MSGPTVTVERLRRTHVTGGEKTVALDDVDLVFPAGSRTAVMGPSGSGKSTLLMILAGLDRPTSGRVLIGKVELTAFTERELLQARARVVTIVVQRPDRNLLGYGTALDNVRFAQRAARRLARNLPEPQDLLTDVGLSRSATSPADRLSGGERQRLSLAVGLACRPDLLLLDEPTSQLDPGNRDAIMSLLQDLHARYQPTLVTVTHDDEVAAHFPRRVVLRDGRVAG